MASTIFCVLIQLTCTFYFSSSTNRQIKSQRWMLWTCLMIGPAWEHFQMGLLSQHSCNPEDQLVFFCPLQCIVMQYKKWKLSLPLHWGHDFPLDCPLCRPAKPGSLQNKSGIVLQHCIWEKKLQQIPYVFRNVKLQLYCTMRPM